MIRTHLNEKQNLYHDPECTEHAAQCRARLMQWLVETRRPVTLQPALLLDTNVLSELRRGPKCDPHVRSWAKSLGRLNAKQTQPVIDGLLAATAAHFQLTIASRNLSDFPSDIPTINPWEFKG